jgi:hypothetical protein
MFGRDAASDRHVVVRVGRGDGRRHDDFRAESLQQLDPLHGHLVRNGEEAAIALRRRGE